MNTSSEVSYFDLHTTGVGYLNRVRNVTPKQGQPYLACSIAALVGISTDVQYRYFDLRVSGEQAQQLIQRFKAAVDDKQTVLLGFRIGDLWPDLFTYTRGDKAGKQGISLKGRLLFISWIKVDGELAYKANPHNNAATETGSSSATLTPETSEAGDTPFGAETLKQLESSCG